MLQMFRQCRETIELANNNLRVLHCGDTGGMQTNLEQAMKNSADKYESRLHLFEETQNTNSASGDATLDEALIAIKEKIKFDEHICGDILQELRSAGIEELKRCKCDMQECVSSFESILAKEPSARQVCVEEIAELESYSRSNLNAADNAQNCLTQFEMWDKRFITTPSSASSSNSYSSVTSSFLQQGNTTVLSSSSEDCEFDSWDTDDEGSSFLSLASSPSLPSPIPALKSSVVDCGGGDSNSVMISYQMQFQTLPKIMTTFETDCHPSKDKCYLLPGRLNTCIVAMKLQGHCKEQIDQIRASYDQIAKKFGDCYQEIAGHGREGSDLLETAEGWHNIFKKDGNFGAKSVFSAMANPDSLMDQYCGAQVPNAYGTLTPLAQSFQAAKTQLEHLLEEEQRGLEQVSQEVLKNPDCNNINAQVSKFWGKAHSTRSKLGITDSSPFGGGCGASFTSPMITHKAGLKESLEKIDRGLITCGTGIKQVCEASENKKASDQVNTIYRQFWTNLQEENQHMVTRLDNNGCNSPVDPPLKQEIMSLLSKAEKCKSAEYSTLGTCSVEWKKIKDFVDSLTPRSRPHEWLPLLNAMNSFSASVDGSQQRPGEAVVGKDSAAVNQCIDDATTLQTSLTAAANQILDKARLKLVQKLNSGEWVAQNNAAALAVQSLRLQSPAAGNAHSPGLIAKELDMFCGRIGAVENTLTKPQPVKTPIEISVGVDCAAMYNNQMMASGIQSEIVQLQNSIRQQAGGDQQTQQRLQQCQQVTQDQENMVVKATLSEDCENLLSLITSTYQNLRDCLTGVLDEVFSRRQQAEEQNMALRQCQSDLLSKLQQVKQSFAPPNDRFMEKCQVTNNNMQAIEQAMQSFQTPEQCRQSDLGHRCDGAVLCGQQLRTRQQQDAQAEAQAIQGCAAQFGNIYQELVNMQKQDSGVFQELFQSSTNIVTQVQQWYNPQSWQSSQQCQQQYKSTWDMLQSARAQFNQIMTQRNFAAIQQCQQQQLGLIANVKQYMNSYPDCFSNLQAIEQKIQSYSQLQQCTQNGHGVER